MPPRPCPHPSLLSPAEAEAAREAAAAALPSEQLAAAAAALDAPDAAKSGALEAALALANEQVRVLHGAARRMIDAAAAREERAQRTYRESTRHLQPEMPALPSELLAWGGSAPPPSVPVRSTFKTLFKQQQLVQKREEERAEAAALESKATKRLANMASIAASKSMRSMPGLAR